MPRRRAILWGLGWRGLAGLALAAIAVPLAAQSEDLGQQGQIWNLGTQQTGRTFPTEINVANVSCRGARDFSVSVEGIAQRFLKITGPTTLSGIRRGQTRTTPAQLDLRGIEAGVHNGGTVVIRCLNCPASCRLDHQVLTIHLTVTGTPAAPDAATAVGESGPAAAADDAPWQFDPSDAETQDAYEFLPRVGCGWDSMAGAGEALSEVDGGFVFSPVLFQTSGAGAPATGPRTAAGGGAAATAVAQSVPRQPLTTQARELCLDNLGPCEELLARVRAAESAASASRARADRLSSDEEYDRSVADSIEGEIEFDKTYIANMRRQAAAWRELAESARADARTNRARAQRQPEYAESWRDEARRDEERAERREANARRLDAEADRLEGRIRDKQDRADEQAGRAEAARQDAAAKEEAVRLAQAAYEACVEQQRLECERQRRQEILASRARAAAAAEAASTSSTTTSSGPTTTAGAGATGSTSRGWLPNYETLPVKSAPYCQWIRYNVPRGATVDYVAVRASSRRDTVSAVEVRRMTSSESTVGQGFDYHCKSATGTAVIVFHLSEGGIKRYKMRIGCTE